ncbi:MAG: PAS domain-containing protein [Gammaproteobacteria bacterium]|nr:PAS domain-containing protein [Gammaproteobacteria bacterium]
MELNLTTNELEQTWTSVERMFAVIVFTPQGEVMAANGIFLQAMGYTLAEIEGKHHRMFCSSEYVQSPAYAEFWTALARGESVHGTFRRLRKDGSEIFLYAEYAPLLDAEGRVVKVIKIAQNISRVAENLIRQLGMSEKLIGRLMTL